MKPLLINLFHDATIIQQLANTGDYEIGEITQHHFPDGETYLRAITSLNNRDVVIVDTLNQPDAKMLPLIFLAKLARSSGAKRIGLCAPYLAYMRQDKQFHTGEALTSAYFAELISTYFDWLITVDPHLHRHHNLSEIFTISNQVLHATVPMAQWINKNIPQPIIIGPDEESEQWVSQIADATKVPYLILKKKRHTDFDVEVSIPNIENYPQCTPVLVDDIISTGMTMIAAVKQLSKNSDNPITCIGVHGIFADNAYNKLLHAGATQIVTCNTIHHDSNQIDLATIIHNGIQKELHA